MKIRPLFAAAVLAGPLLTAGCETPWSDDECSASAYSATLDRPGPGGGSGGRGGSRGGGSKTKPKGGGGKAPAVPHVDTDDDCED